MKNCFKTTIKLLGVLALFAFNSANAGSPVWGTYKVECPANSDTYIGITTTRTPVFTGKVQSVQSGTTNIVAQGEPNWSANQFVYVAGSQTNHYYLKFTSGELEGAWYDIKSNGAYSTEIEIGEGELAKVKANDTFQIIPHWTLQTLFPDGGGLRKNTVAAFKKNATQIHKYTDYSHEAGVDYQKGINNAPLKTFYYRDYSSTKSWMTNTKKTPDEVIEPNTILCIRDVSGTPMSFTYSGVISMSAMNIEAYNLSVDKDTDNYIAISTPIDIKLSDLTEPLVDSGLFVPCTSARYSAVDAIYVYDREATGINKAASHKYYYRVFNGKASWYEGAVAQNDVSLPAGSAIILRKKCIGNIAGFRTKYKLTNIGEN